MARTQILLAVIAAALIAVGVAAWYVLAPGTDSAPGTDAPVTVVVRQTDRTLGDPRAPITVVEYAAPQCPVCARMNAEGFPVLKAGYIDTGKVYYVFRVFPIGPADVPAEGIASCLPRDQYFTFLDMLFRTQERWDPEYGVSDVEGGLIAAGHVAGLSTDKIRSCMRDPSTMTRIKQVAGFAATRYGITGTPTFIVDGKVLAAGMPWNGVKAAIDAALAAKK